jgi:phosphate transport system substrate-binding protein
MKEAIKMKSPQQIRCLLGTLAILAPMLTACVGEATQTAPAPAAVVPQTTLTISGSGETTMVLQVLADGYKEQHSDLAFDFLAGMGSSGGVRGVLGGQLDLGAMSRLPKDAEWADGIAYLSFGTDRIVVATSPELSIPDLTTQQVKDIFLGTITNWAMVGGPDAAIKVLVREEEDTATTILREGIFGDRAFASGAVVLTSESNMKPALSNTINAIGYLHYSTVRTGDLKVHPLVLGGQDPADLDSNYLYTRALGVCYLPASAAKVEPFLNFIVSPEAQALLVEHGIAPAK